MKPAIMISTFVAAARRLKLDVFRHNFGDFYVLAIFASPETRHDRLMQRGRGDDDRHRMGRRADAMTDGMTDDVARRYICGLQAAGVREVAIGRFMSILCEPKRPPAWQSCAWSGTGGNGASG